MGDGLDPETEKSLRDALNAAAEDVRQDGITDMAAYMRSTYKAFQDVGFGRVQSFAFTIVFYRTLMNRG